MLPNDRAQPAAPDKPSWGHRAVRDVPAASRSGCKVVVGHRSAIPLAGLIILVVLVYGVVAVVQGRRTVGRTRLGRALGRRRVRRAAKGDRTWIYSVILLPFAVALAAHARLLARSFVPCRTVAWVLAWSVLAGVIAFKAATDQPFIGTIAAWLLAAAVLGWRVAKGIQDTRMYGGRRPAARETERTRTGNPGGPAADRREQGQPGRPAHGRPGAPAARASGPTGPSPRRRPTATTPATSPPRPGRGRRSRSKTRWTSSTR